MIHRQQIAREEEALLARGVIHDGPGNRGDQHHQQIAGGERHAPEQIAEAIVRRVADDDPREEIAEDDRDDEQRVG